MCTVSFVPVNNSVIITSNRDEHVQRQNAAAPAFHHINNKNVIFPKDAKAGGSWFAACNNGTVAVLLNGAFEKHVPMPPYKKSRGLVLLDVVADDRPLGCFRETDLDQIEPFTLILFRPGHLHELRWDGSRKYEKPLIISGAYIWSSATLYAEDAIIEREKLFRGFIMDAEHKDPKQVHDFHNAGNDDPENGFVISRETGMKTFSITQAVIAGGRIDFMHDDLLQHKQYHQSMSITATVQ